MSLVDFLSGFFLMNAMPHFVLGVWKGRMLSLFGMSNVGNVAYGLLNFVVATSLFVSAHGVAGFAENGVFAGGFLVLVLYLISAPFWYRLYRRPEASERIGTETN